MASIDTRATKKGPRYDVRYRTPAGKQRTTTFRTKREANQFARGVETDKARGEWIDPLRGRITLREYATEWLETNVRLRPRTRETYEAQLRLHVLPALGGVPLSKITPDLVRRWRADLSGGRLSANTVAKIYRLLRTILGTAVDDERIPRNPCHIPGAGIERADERPTATIEQVWKLADAVQPRYRCLVLLAGFCGLRLGELLGLERRHVNPLRGTIGVEQQEQQLRDGTLIKGAPKSDAGRRTIALPRLLVPELDEHLARYSAPGMTGRVFPGAKGGALRHQVWRKHWIAARTAAGLPGTFRFHDLRHTANTLTASTGASTAELMRRFGHSTPAAALRYQHATNERDVEIAAAVDELVTRDQKAGDGASLVDGVLEG